MLQAKGANAQILIQEEADGFGQDPAAVDGQVVPFVSCGLKLARALSRSETIRSSRNASKPGRDVVDAAGPLVVELQAYVALLLKGLFGSVATTGAGPYTHTFKVGASLPSFVVERGFTDIGQYFKYNGVKVNRLGMDVTRAGNQNLTFDLVGIKETVAQAAYDATPTDLGFQQFDGLSLATIEEGGVAIAKVLGIQGLSIENDLDTDQYPLANNGERDQLPEGMVRVSGRLRARFEDLALYNKAIAHTESSLRLLWQLGTGDGSAGNESLELKIPELVYSPDAPVVNGPRGVDVELPFEGYYEDAAEASSIQAILKNTQATV